VAGSSCSIPRPGRACSSYLIESAERSIVADLGSGAFANVRRYREAEQIDAVVISHMHADHFLDVIPMRYALKYGTRTNAHRPLLYLPPGGERMLRDLVGTFASESGADFLGDVFDVRVYDPNAALVLADVTLRFAPTSHYIPTFAMRFEAAGASFAYSADTAPDERVIELAAGADAFLCEATLSPAGEAEVPRGHVSAREAARMAATAHVGRLLLSHYPASANLAELARAARAEFDGPVDVVDDGFRSVFGFGVAAGQ
jgi:ribonuclease BN (tRNA processing enzyme)